VVTDRQIERGIAVFSNWAVFGAAGLGFIMDGIQQRMVALSLVGIAAVIVGFVGHLIVNSYFHETFSRGEAALGLATLGAIVAIFVVSWLTTQLSRETVITGITLIGGLLTAGGAYIATRFGLRGAFSRFHKPSPRGAGK